MQLTMLSYLDFIIQIAILGVLVISYFFIRKKNLRQHGALMTSVFVVNTILLVAVMLPPFLSEGTEIFGNILDMDSLLLLSHHVLGLIAELLGAFLVFRWAIKAFNTSFCKGKILMRVTMGTWLASILLGAVIFILHFIE
jgi:uncharacterized membrane protein YozB (DUF420 family)